VYDGPADRHVAEALGQCVAQPRAGLWQVAQEMAPDLTTAGRKTTSGPEQLLRRQSVALVDGMAAGRRKSASRVCGSVLVRWNCCRRSRQGIRDETIHKEKAREISLDSAGHIEPQGVMVGLLECGRRPFNAQ